MTALPYQDKINPISRGQAKPRKHRVQFGDGYIQRGRDGINNRVELWTIVWSVLTDAEFTALKTVLDADYPSDVLTWTPPDSSTEKQFIVTEEGYSFESVGLKWRVSCALEQVFEP